MPKWTVAGIRTQATVCRMAASANISISVWESLIPTIKTSGEKGRGPAYLEITVFHTHGQHVGSPAAERPTGVTKTKLNL